MEEVRRLLERTPGLTRLQRCHLLAQVAIETGNGRGMQNFNVGNLIVSSSQQSGPALFWRPPWFTIDENSSERERDLHQLMLDGREPSAFRAYGSLEEGIAAYVARLRERFPTLLQARDARTFVTQWKASGYTPRLNVEATLRTFRQLAPCSRSSGGSFFFWALALGGGALWLTTRRK
jgi:hypothetical protein